jgi:hypothetical protein
MEKFYSHPSKKDKILPIQLKAAQICTASASKFAHIFFQKLFLDT